MGITKAWRGVTNKTPIYSVAYIGIWRPLSPPILNPSRSAGVFLLYVSKPLPGFRNHCMHFALQRLLAPNDKVQGLTDGFRQLMAFDGLRPIEGLNCVSGQYGKSQSHANRFQDQANLV